MKNMAGFEIDHLNIDIVVSDVLIVMLSLPPALKPSGNASTASTITKSREPKKSCFYYYYYYYYYYCGLSV